MNTILNKIKRDLDVRCPMAAFAVIENGPDAFDYVVKVFFSSKRESIEAGKWKAEIYAGRSNDDACYSAVLGCSYSVIDVTDHLMRYYWEQGIPFPSK